MQNFVCARRTHVRRTYAVRTPQVRRTYAVRMLCVRCAYACVGYAHANLCMRPPQARMYAARTLHVCQASSSICCAHARRSQLSHEWSIHISYAERTPHVRRMYAVFMLKCVVII